MSVGRGVDKNASEPDLGWNYQRKMTRGFRGLDSLPKIDTGFNFGV